MTIKKKIKKTIGALDRVDFPELGLQDIPCKIDTGARTSAIHCHRVKLLEKDGVEILSFKLLDPSHPEYVNKVFKVSDFQERKVKSSFGNVEYRYVIKTKIKLFDQEFTTELTLADRERMKYPVLIGSQSLKGRFLVDVSKKNLSYKGKQAK